MRGIRSGLIDSVWVLAGADYWIEESPHVQTYVIQPEVAMADS